MKAIAKFIDHATDQKYILVQLNQLHNFEYAKRISGFAVYYAPNFRSLHYIITKGYKADPSIACELFGRAYDLNESHFRP